MYALKSLETKNEECKRQIDKLRERETRLWTSLPEWRTRLQAERQGWSEMWQRKLKQEDEPKHKRRVRAWFENKHKMFDAFAYFGYQGWFGI
jgi:hypothetical protein